MYSKCTSQDFFQWHVVLYLSKTRKEANLWFSTRNQGKRSPMTSDGTITAIRHALHVLLEFKDQVDSVNHLKMSRCIIKIQEIY